MSDITTETNTEIKSEDESIEIIDEPQGDKTEIDWKSEARKWEGRAKAAKADSEAAAKWKEYEQSQKSEYEKLAEKLESAEALASEASAKLIRYEVASQKSIPAEAIDLLTGSTREELEQAAEKLLSLMANQSKTPIKPDLNQGKPTSSSQTTADSFASALSDLL
jgi:hypothetical protein